ncbi:MAG: hypothetical protein E7321_03030 [Clostridiales bacterium]|nr:hypothetical protein [Clostridiales bacterium]
MSDWALFWGVAAMLCAAYALHGGWLAQRWGIDPSRKTQASLDARGKRHSGGTGLFVVGYGMASFLGALLMLGSMMDCAGWLTTAVIFVWSTALCGTLSFAALFASVRCAKGLPEIAGEELFPAAKKIMHALALLLTVTEMGLVVNSFVGSLSSQVDTACIFASGAVLWLALSAMVPAQLIAPRIRSERTMRRASYGGAVCLGMIVLALDTADRSRLLPQLSAFPLVIWMIILWYFLVGVMMLCLGYDAIVGMLKSELPKKKRAPGFVWVMLCAAMGIALGFIDTQWLLILSCTAGAAYVLLAVIACAKWFNRIGRGLFSRN